MIYKYGINVEIIILNYSNFPEFKIKVQNENDRKCGGNAHTVYTAAATPGKQSGASVRRADRSGARRIQHVCKCNVDPVKSDLTKLLCFS